MTLTFRRPGDLARALSELLPHVESVAGAELLVVDNDTTPTARAVVERWAVGHPVRYVHEPRPGISAARNRALDEAGDAELVVFIDDDERPLDGWLESLVAAFRRYPCTGVAGRVVSTFDEPLRPWIEAGGWFDRLRHPTGTLVPVVATNNLLVDVAALQRWGVRFDERFGLSGGSDTVFALEVARHGGTFVWCDEATVVDVVPAARATPQWVVRRAFRSGNSGSRAAVHVARGSRERLGARGREATRGLVRLVAGVAVAGVGALTGDLRRGSRGVRTAVRGAGMLTGAFGYVFSEYARR